MPVIPFRPHSAVVARENIATWDLPASQKQFREFDDQKRAPLQVCPGLRTGNVTAFTLPGVDLSVLRVAAEEFGWTTRASHHVREVAITNAGPSTIAVLIQREIFGPGCSWAEAIGRFHSAVPYARLIVCHGFSEAIDWDDLCDLGAFHSIHFPLNQRELRQSFGFIWQAAKRSVRSVQKTLPISPEVSALISWPTLNARAATIDSLLKEFVKPV